MFYHQVLEYPGIGYVSNMDVSFIKISNIHRIIETKVMIRKSHVLSYFHKLRVSNSHDFARSQ